MHKMTIKIASRFYQIAGFILSTQVSIWFNGISVQWGNISMNAGV